MQRMDQDHVQRILSDAVVEFARETRFDVAFGGLERAGSANLTAICGAENDAVERLLVRADQGLGGRALRERRPRIAVNYVASRQITHEYDAHVVGERIVGLFAVPVLVDGAARAVLYGGTRRPAMPETDFVRAAAGVARDLARELRIEDEVTRRLAARQGGFAAAGSPEELSPPQHFTPAAIEALRDVHAWLRGAVAQAPTRELRERLREVEQKVTGLCTIPLTPGRTAEASPPIRLSPREIDTLAHVALGATNAEIGDMLGLTENTIKSYLNAAMTKLDASTRYAAVSRARSLGYLL